jgi:hypothetical protein
VVQRAGRDTAGTGGLTRCIRSVRCVQGTGARRDAKPKGLGARDVGKARGGLGKVRTGRERRGGGAGAGVGATQAQARGRRGALWLHRFDVTRFDRVFLKIFQLKCTK